MRPHWLALCLLLALVPTAQAQTAPPDVEIEVATDPVPLMPEVGQAQARIVARVGCSVEDLRHEPTRVTFRLREVPHYASAVLSPSSESQTFTANECALTSVGPSSYRHFSSAVTVSTTRDAPAFMDAMYRVVVEVEKPGGARYGPFEASFVIKNDYLPQTVVEPGSLSASARPGEEVAFPVKVTNLGNGPTRVLIETRPMGGPGDARIERIVAGAELRLESRTSRGPEALYVASRSIDVLAPGTPGAYQFVATFRSMYDGVSGGSPEDETQVVYSLLVEGEAESDSLGSDEPAGGTAPGAGLPLLALALLGAALSRRR